MYLSLQDVVAGAAIDLLQGYVVAQHLDSISKELVHLNEERYINIQRVGSS